MSADEARKSQHDPATPRRSEPDLVLPDPVLRRLTGEDGRILANLDSSYPIRVS